MEIKSQFEYEGKTAYVIYRDVDSFGDLKDKNVTQVYAVCFWKDKIVLVHNSNQDSLSLPGGGLEKGETLEECLRREIKEETNMKVLSFAPIGHQEVTSADSPAIFQLRYVCVVEPYGDFTSDPDGDVDQIKTIDPKEFKDYIKWGEVGDRIFERALEFKNTLPKTKIRKAKTEDLNEIMNVICDVSEKEQKESKEKILKRISDDQLLLCCLDNDKVIGFLGWNSKFQHNSNNWYLEQITLHKDYRGQGIGKELVRYFMDLCRKNGVKKVYAHVQEHNERSLKMFLDTGWKINNDSDKKVDKEITIEFEIQ